MQFGKLRTQYPHFHYHQYQWQFHDRLTIEVSFEFEIEGVSKFYPKSTFYLPFLKTLNLSEKSINQMVFSMGLIEMISYFKATCSPDIHIHCGFLNEEQIDFWHELIFKGLGEFRFLNKITTQQKDFTTITIVHPQKKESFEISTQKLEENILIPLGGGKDSIVTLELLKQKFPNLYVYMLNPSFHAKEICRLAGVSEEHLVIASRKIDPALLKLNQQGFLNGHTPFSALLSFQSAFLCSLLNLRYCALSNEASANEGNVAWAGDVVNHQYSKTLEYEKNFQNYSSKYLNQDFKYFSFLRPFKELQIAKFFSEMKKYHEQFVSCNQINKIGKWCGHCPKCLFVWVILSPYLEQNELIKIFSSNLWGNFELNPLLAELAGKQGYKPFDCVGSIEEVQTALSLVIKKNEKNKELPPLLQAVKDWYIDVSESEEWQEHSMPSVFIEILKNAKS